jgi:PiT family inorganic phosphate transporter
VTTAHVLVVLIVLIALIFDFTNGFHDAANAIATTVATKALTARHALVLAAIGNLIGAFLSEGVAKTVGKGVIEVE